MDPTDKTAAAILAVESFKMLHAMNPQLAKRQGFNIASELVRHYQGILATMNDRRT